MPEIILLPSGWLGLQREVGASPTEPVEVPEGMPTTDGYCTQPGCGSKVFRFLDESAGKALTPSCIVCNKPYPLTPRDIFLPLLVINQRAKK
jgi:hypothetical protein